MRAGKKQEAENGKTRPCIVYVKNLKESTTTEIINAAAAGKLTEAARNNIAKIASTRRNQTDKERQRERELELERMTPRSTRLSRRATTIAAETNAVASTPIATRTRNANTTATLKGAAKSTPQQQQQSAKALPLSKRRNTAVVVHESRTSTQLSRRRATTRQDNITSEPTTTSKSKMYKQMKAVVHTPVAGTPPPTIAASRSRRSIKPNPKYASEDIVTPKYVAALSHEGSNKRTVKHLFADDDDEDEDMRDLIEEDNDDELNDAAFNPQLHKSDDDDDISDNEFEQRLMREKVPPKRGRGRPPKNASAVLSNTQSSQARSATTGHAQGARGTAITQSSGRTGVTNLQQMRRNMNIAPSLARSHMKVLPTAVGNKRKLEDSTDTPIARKRMATEISGVGRSQVTSINGGGSGGGGGGTSTMTKTTNIGLNKAKVGNNNNNNINNNSSSNSGLRMQQQQQQQTAIGKSSQYKQQWTALRTRSPEPVTRTPVSVSTNNAHKAQKAQQQQQTVTQSLDTEDVPTFTIVNIEDIINQDDVLISRTSNTNKNQKSATLAARNNNNSNNNNNNSNNNNNNNNSNSNIGSSRKSQSSQQQTPPTKAITGSNIRNTNTTQSNNLATNRQRPKATNTAAATPSTTTTTSSSSALAKSTTTTTTTKQQLLVNNRNSKQVSQVVAVGAQAKPRPRILNAEMGKKMPAMTKPLMSMGKELCPTTDGPDTEDDDINIELADIDADHDADDINISSSSSSSQTKSTLTKQTSQQGTTQTRIVRRVQNTKIVPNRRNVLSTATTVNAANNQRQQQQQQQLRKQQQQQQQQTQKEASSDRKLTKLLGDIGSDDDVFKKPTSLSSSTVSSTQQQRSYKENTTKDVISSSSSTSSSSALQTPTTTTTATATTANQHATESKNAKYFPPETTTYCQKDGRIVKKITCYETWHVIGALKESPRRSMQQTTSLELPLVKLANVAARIKLPSSKWTTKVTLYKLPQAQMQRQTMTIFTGDLKSYNIPEEERHKYQPSCVLFRRTVLDRSKCRVPFDRAIIFKNKCFYTNIEGKHVNLLGAPDVINTVKEVEMLIDIVDTLSLSSNLVEIVTS